MSDKTEQHAKAFEALIRAAEIMAGALTRPTRPMPKMQEVIARAKRALAEMRGGA